MHLLRVLCYSHVLCLPTVDPYCAVLCRSCACPSSLCPCCRSVYWYLWIAVWSAAVWLLQPLTLAVLLWRILSPYWPTLCCAVAAVGISVLTPVATCSLPHANRTVGTPCPAVWRSSTHSHGGGVVSTIAYTLCITCLLPTGTLLLSYWLLLSHQPSVTLKVSLQHTVAAL